MAICLMVNCIEEAIRSTDEKKKHLNINETIEIQRL